MKFIHLLDRFMQNKGISRYINGTKGFISLMVIVSLLPFYSLAVCLEEYSRYQAGVKAVDEAMGSSALSTLSNYDQFLLDRFGLLAVSQDNDNQYNTASPAVGGAAAAGFGGGGGFRGSADPGSFIEATFQGYMQKQKTLDVLAFKMDQQEAEGIYPLGDVDVLRQQVLETSTVMVPVEFGKDLINFDELKSTFEKLGHFDSILDFISGANDVVDGELDVIDSIDDLEKQCSVIERDNKAYKESFDQWKKAAEEYQKHHATERPSDEEEAAKWDEEDAKYKTEAESKKNEYLGKIDGMLGNMDDLQEKVNSVKQTADNLGNNIISFSSDMASNYYEEANESRAKDQNELDKQFREGKITPEKWMEESGEIQIQNKKSGIKSEILSGLSDSCDEVSNTVNESLTTNGTNDVTSKITALQRNKARVQNYPEDSLPTEDLYYDCGDLGSYKEIAKKLDNESNDTSVDFSMSYLTDLIGILDAVLNMQAFYDNDLDVSIYASSFNGRPSNRSASRSEIISSYISEDSAKSQAYKDAIRNNAVTNYNASEPDNKLERITDQFLNGLAALREGYNLYKEARKLKDKLEALDTCIDAAYDIVSSLLELAHADLAAPFRQMNERNLIMGYMAYNLPNRCNYPSFRSKGGLSPKSQNFVPINLLPASLDLFGTEKEDYSFAGAELEYIVAGNRRERDNQSRVFNILWIMRALIDIVSILLNSEFYETVEAVTAVGTIIGPILAVIYVVAVIVLEPFLDTFILANGGDIGIYKKTLFLTPSGVPELLKKFSTIVQFTKAEEKELTNKIKNKLNMETKPDKIKTPDTEFDRSMSKFVEGLIELDYLDHVLIFMILCGNTDKYLKRLQDIIEMERTYYNRHGGSTASGRVSGEYKTFNIDRAYTTMRMHVHGDFQFLLPIPSLSGQSPLSTDRVMYRGY